MTILAEMNLEIVSFVDKVRACPKCGHRRFRAPIFIIRWFDLPFTSFDLTYCPGNLDPVHTSTRMTLTSDGPEMCSHDTPVACASLRTEHFHCKCNECGYRWIMMGRSSDKK